MAAVTHGMDVAAVKNLAATMNKDAEQIRQLMAALDSMLRNAAWVGPDSQQFRGEWDGKYKPQLNQVAQGLQEAAGKANRNANEQEQASGH